MGARSLPRLFAVAGALGAAALAVYCTPPAFNSSIQTLGQFNLCLRRLTDTCAAQGADGGCQTLATNGGQVSLGVDSKTGRFYWSRAGLTPISGTRVGDRFQVSTTEPDIATVCGCAANVTETILGELSVSRVSGVGCSPAIDAGCGEVAAAPVFFDGGLPGRDWLEGADPDAGSGVTYGSFTATVEDQVSASKASAKCTCSLPCQVQYEVLGTQ